MPERGTPSQSGIPVDGPDDETFDDVNLDGNLSAAEGVSGDADKGSKPEAKVSKEDGRKKKKRYTPDDMGNAARLLDEFGEEMRWDESLKEWRIWDGRQWNVDSHLAMRNAMTVPEKIKKQANTDLLYSDGDEKATKKATKLLDWGNQCGNLNRLRSMLDISRSFPGISVSMEDFNRDSSLIACPNGTLVLGRTGATFRSVRKGDYCTNVTSCDYSEGSKSPLWADFLDRFLPEHELRVWAQKLAGYSMLGGNPARKIVFCWGPTSSGKSTFAEVINDALGGYAGSFNLSLMRDNQDERARPDLVRAMDQRVIFASEASSAWRLHADQIKRVTGQDRIMARMPHVGASIDKVPDFTPWIVTNNIPTIDGADIALYRRLATVLFPHTIEGSDENVYFRRDIAESGGLSGVLAWLVEGWNLYCSDGLGDPPDRVVRSELKMREQFSDVDIFLAGFCESGPGHEYRAVPSELYDAYEQWHEANGGISRDKMSGTAFGRALSARGYDSKMVRAKGAGNPVRRRVGIRLKKG